MIKSVVIISVYALSLMFLGCSKADGENASDVSKTKTKVEYNQQYNFTVETLSGEQIALSDYQGKVVIVDLWDTWCPPCRMEIPHFIELYNEYNDQGFEMIGLAFGRDGLPAVKEFIEEYGINYINATVNQDVINRLGSPRGIPTTYVFDQTGNIHQKYVGYREKSIFENDIKTLLGL